MKKIKISTIHEGARYDESLFLSNGQKLLNANVKLNARHLRVLAGLPDTELYLAGSLEELVAAGVVKAMDGRVVRPGATADHDILTAGGHLVVEQGQEIEQHHIDAIKQGAFSAANDAHAAEQARMRRDRMVMADALVDQLLQDSQSISLRVQGEATDIWADQSAGQSQWPQATELTEERARIVTQIHGWYSQIESGLGMSVATVHAVVDALYEQLLNYPRHVAQLALMCPGQQRYLPDHAFNVTVLSMAMAAQLRWSPRHIKQIGVSGLLMDVGMLLVPERIRLGGCTLSEIDRNRVQRHTAYTIALIESVQDVETEARLAMYQHHERETGVGYPVGSRGDSICDYARVLGVADVFCAAVSYRAYHTPKLPYVVMEEIIRSSAAGIFDKSAARALVQAAGLFPVGSYVLLSNHRIAHVLAVNTQRLDRPVVRVLEDSGEPTEHVVDLLQIPVEKLSVSRPTPSPSMRQSVA